MKQMKLQKIASKASSGIKIVVKLCRDPGDEVVVLNPIMTEDFEASYIWGAPPP